MNREIDPDTAEWIQAHRDSVEVIVFARVLNHSIAGGTRAVLQRANTLVDAGLRVTLILTEPSPSSRQGRVALRRAGTLDRRIDVIDAWSEFIPLDARRKATVTAPARGPWRDPAWVIEEPDKRLQRARRNYFDGEILMRRDHLVHGRVQMVSEYESAQVVRRFFFGEFGNLQTVVHYEDGIAVSRDHYAGGSLHWASVSLSPAEGRGALTRHDGGASGTIAEFLAEAIDQRFAHSGKLVVFADGENTAQHVLRAMKHPNVAGVSVLHNCHTVDPYRSTDPTRPNWLPYFEPNPNVKALVCLTERQRQDLVERYPHLKPHVIHHAVARQRLPEVARDPLRAVFVGRLQEQKRLDHAIRAFALAAKKVKGAKFDIYGSGADLEGLEALVRELGVEDSVTFMGRTRSPRSAFASASFAVMSSLYEGLPLTITESMEVGTPVIAYDINYGPAEVIEDGVNGRLITPGDIEALGEAIADAFSHPDKVASWRDRAIEVIDDFSPAKYADRWIGLAREAAETGIRPEGETKS